MTWGQFPKIMYDLHFKFLLCAILFEHIYSGLAPCICALHSATCIFAQFWLRTTLYAVRPTFMKSTPEAYEAVVHYPNQTFPKTVRFYNPLFSFNEIFFFLTLSKQFYNLFPFVGLRKKNH